jgi:hypothetical protein
MIGGMKAILSVVVYVGFIIALALVSVLARRREGYVDDVLDD